MTPTVPEPLPVALGGCNRLQAGGDWSIYRPKDSIHEENESRKMDQSPAGPKPVQDQLGELKSPYGWPPWVVRITGPPFDGLSEVD